jgi:hypothetical protein
VPTHAYCTYFDSGYLSRGLALIDSLRANGDHSPVWVLALDDEARAYLDAAHIPNVFTLAISDIEAAEPELLPLKASRSRMEYYFTSTPLLMRWVLGRQDNPTETTVIYLDSDLYFFDDPDLVLQALGAGSVGIIEHRYPARLEKRLAKYGRFNVGWVGVKGDANGLACLDWWASRTLEWCFDVPSDGRYADQGYLDSFPELFDGVVILRDPGLNLAPWNTARYPLALDSTGRVIVGDSALVFFHFHGLRRVGSWYVTSQLVYGARLGQILRHRVYIPYLRALEGATVLVQPSLAAPPAIKPRGNGFRGLASRALKAATDRAPIFSGNAVSVENLKLSPETNRLTRS